MAQVISELASLFNQVDDWFTDITLDKPVDQFSLGEDQTKLAIINRTTLSWFKSLTNPTITNEGLELDNSDLEFACANPLSSRSANLQNKQQVKKRTRKIQVQNISSKIISNAKNSNRSKPVSVQATRCRKGIQKRPVRTSSNVSELQTLDSLAKNLELLLEGDDNQDLESAKQGDEKQEFYFYNSYKSDELALLDCSIGNCCTLTLNDPTGLKKKLSSPRDVKEFSVVMPSTDYSEYNHERAFNSSLQNEDLSRLQISLPLDHDYLPKPRAKPLVLNNKLLFKSVRNNPKESSVLNTEVIKRFAPFSNRFKELSMKHSVRLLAIENT